MDVQYFTNSEDGAGGWLGQSVKTDGALAKAVAGLYGAAPIQRGL